MNELKMCPKSKVNMKRTVISIITNRITEYRLEDPVCTHWIIPGCCIWSGNHTVTGTSNVDRKPSKLACEETLRKPEAFSLQRQEIQGGILLPSSTT
jgi:hypothetical protein